MGNGGAMRAAPIGAYFADDLDKVLYHARASAKLHMQHIEGIAGAMAVAAAAALLLNNGWEIIWVMAFFFCRILPIHYQKRYEI